MKQFSPLPTAYSMTTAMGHVIQAEKLRSIPEADCTFEAADTEAAISREHTMWMASRTGRGPKT
ncbi:MULTISPECIES: hypothetical protein [Corynebacterium]